MEYCIRSRKLFQKGDDQICARFVHERCPLSCVRNKIASDEQEFYTEVRCSRSMQSAEDREYVLCDKNACCIVKAKPRYAENETCDTCKFHLSHARRMNRAEVEIDHQLYELRMWNSWNYKLSSKDGTVVLEMFHCGIGGGWSVVVKDSINFKPHTILGLYVFCQYLEKENELLIV